LHGQILLQRFSDSLSNRRRNEVTEHLVLFGYAGPDGGEGLLKSVYMRPK
jgi:hypothetical protein